MGYWGKHPMEGDDPSDTAYVIDAIVGELEPTEEMNELQDKFNAAIMKGDKDLAKTIEETFNKEAEMVVKQYTEHFISKLPQLADRFEDHDIKNKFVLPFTIVQCQIRVEDPTISERIKAMIGDGGAADRGYDTAGISDDYNGFESPEDYANQLRNTWDKLMTGEIHFDSIGQAKGMVESVLEGNHNGGLINIK